MCAISEKINSFLEERFTNQSLRYLRPIKKKSPRICEFRNDGLLNFSSNDYLALSTHPKIIAEAVKWAENFGTSFSASRLVCGTTPEIIELEEKIAEWKSCEAAIIIGSGYLANCGSIAALACRKTTILADKLNHASLNSGCAQSGAEFKRYKHLDLDHLETLLRSSQNKEKLIVSDTIFSMDGDKTDIERLYEISKRYNAFLYLDDAHATGVFGRRGEGNSLSFVDDFSNLIVMGTFSKGMGAYGAYLASTKRNIDFLINASGSFIYSTALPPAAYGAISAAIEIVQGEGIRKEAEKLLSHAEMLRCEFRKMGFDCGRSSTQIIPLIVGDRTKTIDLSQKLLDNGILAVAIRPPTVPENSSRIRISINCAHRGEDFSKLLKTLAKINENGGR